MGIKKGIVLCNTVGIIDADYYGNSDNDGHIRVALRNLNSSVTSDFAQIKKGDAIAQAILEPYSTFGEEVKTKRVGGIGSTDGPFLPSNPKVKDVADRFFENNKEWIGNSDPNDKAILDEEAPDFESEF